MSDPEFPPVTALVLAGIRQNGDPLAEAHGVRSKAFIKIAGRSMLGYVLAALSESLVETPVFLSGHEGNPALPEQENWPPFTTGPTASSPAASVLAAAETGKLSFPILVTTCDHTLLSPEIINTFIHSGLKTEADLVVGLATRETVESSYPDVARTYLKLGMQAYSGCNLFLLKNSNSLKAIRFWQSAEVHRKRPWRIAWDFGIISALRILLGRADLDRTFSIASQALGVTAKPALLPFANAAIDVDKPSDLALVKQILEETS